MPEIEIVAKEQRMAVPYALNRPFREIFGTAKWNGTYKLFSVRATAQNRRKWDQFMETVKDACAVLAEAEDSALTANQLERAAAAAEQAVCDIKTSLNECNLRIKIAEESKTLAEAQTAVFRAHLETANAALKKIQADGAKARRDRADAIAPALQLYKAHNLKKILKDFVESTRFGYRGRTIYDHAGYAALALSSDLQAIGFRMKEIDLLGQVSRNRPDLILSLVKTIEATSETGLELLETVSDNDNGKQ
jgi:hypothetical protein